MHFGSTPRVGLPLLFATFRPSRAALLGFEGVGLNGLIDLINIILYAGA